MDNRNSRKPEPWRIAAAALSVVYILYMWVSKDIADVYASMPREEVAPLIATTVLVTLIKVAAIAGVVFLLTRMIGKRK